jgi:hypothetical protein
MINVKKIIISDYFDYNFPRDLVSEDNLVFHGTGKIMADLIEKQGFISGVKPYDFSDLKSLIEIYQRIGYGKQILPYKVKQVSDSWIYNTGYWSLTTYAVKGNRWHGFRDKNSPYPSFTHNYWQAGNYSTKNGGETIRNFIKCIDEILEFFSDKEKIEKHKEEVRTKSLLANFDGEEPNNNILENLNNLTFLNEKRHFVSSLLDKKIEIFQDETYRTFHANHQPEIIAVRYDSKKLDKMDNEFAGVVNDLVATSDIPPEDIVARISFNEGHRKSIAWDIIRGEISEMDPKSARTFDINSEFVAKYGEKIEDKSLWMPDHFLDFK